MEIQSAHGLVQWAKIYALYRSAFPRNERKPISIIYSNQKKGKSDVWYFTENRKFVGLATTVNGDDGKVLLDYFAVTKKDRSHGLGSGMLPLILQQYQGRDVFGEIEYADEHADEHDQRVRRKQFYLRNGMRALGIRISLFDVDMEILTNGCDLTFPEYLEFYRKNIGEFAVDHISETKIQ